MLAREVALALCLLAEAAAARAADRVEPTYAWLHWSTSEAAGSCGDRAAFAARVETRLGRSPAVAAANLGLSIFVRVERFSDPTPRWVGEIRAHSRDGAPDGLRSIERVGDSCEPLTATLALMTTLVLQSSGPDGPTPVEKTRPAARAVVAETDPETAAIGGHAEAGTRPWTITLAAGPAAGFGLLPGLVPQGEALVTVRRGSGAAVFVSAFLSSTSSVFIGPAQGATLGRAGLDLGGCAPKLGWGSRELELCGGAEIARLRAVGFGFDLSTVQERWSVAVTAGARLRQRIAGPLFAAIGARLLIPAERDRIAYSAPGGGVEQIFRTAPVAGSGQLLIGVTFR